MAKYAPFKWEQPLITITEFVTAFTVREALIGEEERLDYNHGLKIEAHNEYLEMVARGGYLLEVVAQEFLQPGDGGFHNWYEMLDACVAAYHDVLLNHKRGVTDETIKAAFREKIKELYDEGD